MGIGTAQVESLTGYLARLAVAHRVSVSKLVMDEIVPHFRSPKTRPSFFSANSAGLLRSNDLSQELLQILQRLTGCLNLSCLTVSPWSQLTATIEIVRPGRAWCSGCLAEQRSQGQVVCELLAWSLKPIQLCPRHHQSLQTRCPHCNHPQVWLAAGSNPGYCSSCKAWLGIVPDPHTLALPIMSDFEREWLYWVAEVLGELLAATPTLSHTPLAECLTAGLSHYYALIAGGNITRFAKILADHHLNVSTICLYQWLVGGYQPPWPLLLQLCFCLHTTPLAMLTNPTATPISLPLQTLDFSPSAISQPVKPSANRTQLETDLKTILAAAQDPPPSLNEVAKRLQQPGTNSLVKYFPELCDRIVKRYQTHRQAKKEERIRIFREQVRQAAFTIYDQGAYPSQTRVAQLLAKPVSMRNPHVRAFWQEAVRDLGLEA